MLVHLQFIEEKLSFRGAAATRNLLLDKASICRNSRFLAKLALSEVEGLGMTCLCCGVRDFQRDCQLI
jgi:hypothetical protein